MKKSEIMKIFTAKVAELIARGMWINGETMSGTQGEICKVDLTDGQRLVRVLLANDRTDFHDTVVLLVGTARDDSWKKHTTVWNDSLKETDREVFYKIRRDWYVDSFQEAERISDLHMARVRARENADTDWRGGTRHHFTDLTAARKIALPALRRHPGCKSKRASDIVDVYKETYRGKNTYIIETARCRWELKVKEA
jgi:hypothetical protein